MTYSAAISHSSKVAAMPRFSSTGLRARPTRLSRLKFCMFRVPIWMMSATCSTASAFSVSINSVTMPMPVFLRTLARISRPSSPRP